MTPEQYNALVEQFGKDAGAKIKEMSDQLETKLNDKYKEVVAGKMTTEDFNKFKANELKELNDRLAEAEKLADIVKQQGLQINKLQEGKATDDAGISLEEFFEKNLDKIKEVFKAKSGVIEWSSEDMKKAGVKFFNPRSKVAAATTVAGSVGALPNAPSNPYLPGLGGSDLELFDLVYNPNFILNRVDVGRTNQSRLAWINETSFEGTVLTNILEGGEKPLVQHKFNVEFSTAKKAAAYIILTDEFEADLPGLATAVRRMLQQDVLRAFDDAIQLLVIAAARPYEITGLDGKVPFTTLFDAMGALLAQVGFYNFTPNTLGLNTVTSWEAMMDKDGEGRYLNPPFMSRLNGLLVEANKIAIGYGLAGDLTQFKVDIYKDFTISVGWINDQFITNKFSILGELRYHSYISENRKKAIVYNSLLAVQQKITAGSV
jgi:hypothetical protein